MDSVFAAAPSRIHQGDVIVMQRTTVDDMEHIRAIWPPFEETVGLRGRKMYAMIDTDLHTYTVCTPVREDDRPDELSLLLGTLPGGWYLRGRLIGDPPEVYDRIGVGMAELEAAASRDTLRPLVEYYRRHDQVDLWVPVLS